MNGLIHIVRNSLMFLNEQTNFDEILFIHYFAVSDLDGTRANAA